jgi:hypothetical protein
VVQDRRRRAALQHARLVLLAHGAAAAVAAAAGVLAPLGHVGAHRARRVLVRLRALAARLRFLPVPARVPGAVPRHDRRALALEERGLPPVEADDRRAVAVDRAAGPREPVALALSDPLDPERRRPRAVPAARPARGACSARAPAGRAGGAVQRAGHLRPAQGRSGVERGARTVARPRLRPDRRRRQRDAAVSAVVPLAAAPD